MTAHLPAPFRKRFLGTHFFNPPRYLKLLETIPGPETDPAVLAVVEAFADRVLGKGVVRCKDTPNFIANRIGSFGFGAALSAMADLDLTIEEVDALTGPAIGRAKSATFRTADIAGVDVAVKVAENLHAAAPTDPQRELFRVPDFMKEMVKRGLLGEKAGAGFYKKAGADILTLDWKTLGYRPRQKAKLGSLDGAPRTPIPPPVWPRSWPARTKRPSSCGGSSGGPRSTRRGCCRRSPTIPRPSIGPWSGATAGAPVPSGSWTPWG